jgi:type VI secretion system protein ImpG
VTQNHLEKAFLEELAALERFRVAYTGAYPKTPLSGEDPDVRRLLEGMAMFSARTRLAADRSLHRSILRIFRQHFSYLLGPLPAMAMLRAQPDRNFVDTVDLPRGSEVLLIEPPARGAEPRVFRMRTLQRLRILPIAVDGANLLRVPGKGGGVRMLLHFSSRLACNATIGELSLHVNHLDDLTSSIAVLHALKKHLRAASVVFGEPVREDTKGAPCEALFGAPPLASDEVARTDHPLEKARASLHFSRQELYLTLRGIKAPPSWREFTICLDLDGEFPADLRLTRENVELFVVPMVNERVDMTNPVECDGTQERYALRHPDDSARFVPAGVLGVYRLADEGLVPIEPAFIPEGHGSTKGTKGARRDSYDVIYEGQAEQRRAFLSVHLPRAFETPQKVAVEAVWYQPALRGVRASDLTAKLSDRFISDVAWSCSGRLSLPADSPMDEDRESLFELLSLKNQRFLGVDELRVVLGALGPRGHARFDALVYAITTVDVTSKPFSKSSSGFKYIYTLQFEGLNPSDVPGLELFCNKLLDILSAWSVEEVVDLVARVPSLDAVIHLPSR